MRDHLPIDRLPEGFDKVTSIVIPVFNKVEITQQCLKALRANTPRHLYELIIVDDASSDGTPAFLSTLGDDVTVITNRENLGFTKSCNQGAKAATGDYVLFLNNDTEPQPGWLERLLELMESRPTAGIAGSKLVYPDGRLQEAGGIVFNDGSGWNYGRFDHPDRPPYNYVREVDYVSGAALMIRHPLLKQLDYFDERYSPGYYEDTDLCFGVRSLGRTVVYCPSSVVIHHEGISSGTDLTQGMKRFQPINREKFVQKWADALTKQSPPGEHHVIAASERNVRGNILMADPYTPMFDRASGSLRLFTIIGILRLQGYHITYIARNGLGQERYVAILQQMGVEVYATDPEAMAMEGETVTAPRVPLEQLLKRRHFQVAYLSFFSIAWNYLYDIRRFSPGTKILIDSVDIHFIREQRMGELAQDDALIRRAKNTKHYELAIYEKADAIITVTEQDWTHIQPHLPGKPHFVIPNIHAVGDQPIDRSGRNGLLFVGNFNHPPNVDAIHYFVREVFPLITTVIPDITLTIVGNNPPKEITALDGPRIRVTGYVPSTEPYLRNARVSIVPLRYGAGMKGKIGEAMAHGLPVVTTSIGAEGMGLVHGQTALIADTPREFADAVLALYDDERAWERIAADARQFLRDHYSVEAVETRLAEMLERAAAIQPLELLAHDADAINGVDRKKGRSRYETSIVMLTMNQLAYTKECVNSIRQHTPESHEIIFVDNGSTDGTVQWLKKLVKRHNHYRLIANPTNLGFSRGCNQGIMASSGAHVLLLNNDVVVTEGWLSGLMACLTRTPDTGIVGPMTNQISGPQKISDEAYTRRDLDAYAKAFRERHRHRRIPARRIVGFCMLFRRSLVETIGPLDERFGTGNFEDDDLCLRAALLGHRNVIAGDVFIHHYGSRSFIGNRIDYASAITGNRSLYHKKWSGIDAKSPLGRRLLTLQALEAAEEQFQRGDMERAVRALIDGIGRAPEETELYYRLAELLIDAKNFNAAVDALQSLPDAAKEEARTLVLLGLCREGLKAYADAGRLAIRALELDPGLATALNLGGLLASKSGDDAAAADLFKQAIQADPGCGAPHVNLGVLTWAAGDRREALNLIERGVLLPPLTTDGLMVYHSAATAAGELKRAERTFRELKALYPGHKRVSLLLTDLLLRQEQWRDAMEETERALCAFGVDDQSLAAALSLRKLVGPLQTTRAANGKATLSLCMIVKNEEGNITRCLASVRPIADEIIVVDTGSTDRTRELAEAFGAKVSAFDWTGNFADARNASLAQAAGDWILVLDADEVLSPLDHGRLAAIVRNKPRKPSAYAITTRNYVTQTHMSGWTANNGRYAKEEAGGGWYPSTKVRLFSRDGRVRFEHAVHEIVEPSLRRLGVNITDCDIPVHHYGKLDTGKVAAKGRDYYALGVNKLQEQAHDPKSLYELAIQAGELARFSDAVELWRQFLSVDRPLPLEMRLKAYLNMGRAHLELGAFQEASQAARQAFQLDPESTDAVINYGLSEFWTGDPASAVGPLERLLRHTPDYPPALGLLAVIHLVNGRTEVGRRHLDRISALGLNSAHYLHDQATRLIAAGQLDRASRLLSATIDLGLVHDQTQTLLAQCDAQIGQPRAVVDSSAA